MPAANVSRRTAGEGSGRTARVHVCEESDSGIFNTQVIQPLIDANSRLARSDFPDFNDPNKLGEGSAKVERLSNLIAIFQKPELDFSKNRAEHDDPAGRLPKCAQRVWLRCPSTRGCRSRLPCRQCSPVS
jgi:hypothetical protein